MRRQGGGAAALLALALAGAPALAQAPPPPIPENEARWTVAGDFDGDGGWDLARLAPTPGVGSFALSVRLSSRSATFRLLDGQIADLQRTTLRVVPAGTSLTACARENAGAEARPCLQPRLTLRHAGVEIRTGESDKYVFWDGVAFRVVEMRADAAG